jgi:hypothetical protein
VQENVWTGSCLQRECDSMVQDETHHHTSARSTMYPWLSSVFELQFQWENICAGCGIRVTNDRFSSFVYDAYITGPGKGALDVQELLDRQTHAERVSNVDPCAK